MFGNKLVYYIPHQKLKGLSRRSANHGLEKKVQTSRNPQVKIEFRETLLPVKVINYCSIFFTHYFRLNIDAIGMHRFQKCAGRRQWIP